LSADEPATDRELLIQMNEKLDTLVSCKDDHETRIRSLEGSFWKVIGLASIISFFAGLFGGKLTGGGN
jgi:hypothetical protein